MKTHTIILLILITMTSCSSTFERHHAAFMGSDNAVLKVSVFNDVIKEINNVLGLEIFTLGNNPFPERERVIATKRKEQTIIPDWLIVAYMKDQQSIVLVYNIRKIEQTEIIEVIKKKIIDAMEDYSGNAYISEWKVDQTKSSWTQWIN